MIATDDASTRMIRLPHRLMLAAALATALPAPPLRAQSPQPTAPAIRLPALGESATEEFAVGTERRLGEQIMAEVRRDPQYMDDPLLLDYVQSLWAPLLAAARARGNIGLDLDTAFAWETFLVQDRSVNAFALPGGYVGVHLGLISMTGNSDELASVLAHEMSHVTQRHIARSIASASRQSLVGLAAMVLGVLAASRSRSADATQAVIVGSQAAMAQGQLNFSRDMEREADRVGWGVFNDAGFAPEGVVSMFERLENAYRLTDSGAYPYLRSHPLTVERIGEARARVETALGGRPVARASVAHMLMQARARVLQETDVQSMRRAQAQEQQAAGTSADRLATLYASALASLQLREPARAQAALDAAAPLLRTMAVGESRARLAFALAQAQAWQANGQAARALALLDAFEARDSRPLLLAHAQAALDAARAGGSQNGVRASTESLQTWVAEHKSDATAWGLLGQCTDLLGLKLRSLRAQAEAQAASGDIGGAMDRLRAAQRLARTAGSNPDFVEASIIDSRLRDLTAQRRAQLAALRGENRRGGDPGEERTP